MTHLLELATQVVQSAPGPEAPQCVGCIVMSSSRWMTGMLAGMALFMVVPFLVIFGIGGGLMRARKQAMAATVEREG